MKFKNIITMGITAILVMCFSGGNLASANENEENPHLSDVFEISEEEAINNPSPEEIALKEEMDSMANPRNLANAQVYNAGSSFVNIRSGPGTGYSVKVKVSNLTPLHLDRNTLGPWKKVYSYRKTPGSSTYVGVYGYIHSDYTLYNTGPLRKHVFETKANLNVRTGPSTDTSVVRTIPKGTKVFGDPPSGWRAVWSGYNQQSGYAWDHYLKSLYVVNA